MPTTSPTTMVSIRAITTRAISKTAIQPERAASGRTNERSKRRREIEMPGIRRRASR